MIYLDNAATTRLHPEVLAEMMPFLQQDFGNPSSVHQLGKRAKQAIENARRTFATWLHCLPNELVFTSGGTEAIHAALLGAILASRRRHIVASAVEHHAVLHTLELLQRLGATITLVAPDETGRIQVDDVLAAMQPDTCCVSMMAVNNELGTIMSVAQLAKAVKKQDSRVLFHSDMVQALGTMPHHLAESAIDFASFSAHKIHGPKAVGGLFIRSGVPWLPVMRGGAQEHKRRAGTENVAGIVGFGAAIARIQDHFSDRMAHLSAVKQQFQAGLASIPGLVWNSPADGVPTIANVAINGIRNDTLLMRLDLAGIAASAGSACTAGSLEPSHVLRACGFSEERIGQSLRFSFSEDTTLEDVIEAAHSVRQIVSSLMIL